MLSLLAGDVDDYGDVLLRVVEVLPVVHHHLLDDEHYQLHLVDVDIGEL